MVVNGVFKVGANLHLQAGLRGRLKKVTMGIASTSLWEELTLTTVPTALAQM